MSKVQIIIPAGMMGKYKGEPRIETLLREIAVKYSKDPELEWAEKYGTDFENDVFMMHRYCWCDQESCPWCYYERKPNFIHKETGFTAHWYKYIGRGMEYNMKPPIAKLKKLLEGGK